MSVFLPLTALTVAGWYFLHGYKTKEQKLYFKTNLKKESFYLSKKTDKLLSFLSKELKKIAVHQTFPENSLFSAVALKTSKNSNTYDILLPSLSSSPSIKEENENSPSETQNFHPDSPDTEEKENTPSTESQKKPLPQTDEEEKDPLAEIRELFQNLAARLPENRKQKIWIQDISPSKENKIIAVLLNTSFGKTDLKNKTAVAGFIQQENFRRILPLLDFNDKEANEALLSTSQGWLLFHTKKESLFGRIPSHSPLRKILSKNKPQFASWKFTKKRKHEILGKKSFQTSSSNNNQNLAYILPLKGTNLSIIAKTSFKKPAFTLTEWEWGWMLLSLAALVFMLSLLFLILSPLFTAYSQLKRALSQYSLKGEMPFISPHNRFLRFYSNVWNASQNNKRREMEKETLTSNMKERLTFRYILESVYERLKERYPGLSIQTDIQVNVSLWYFAPLMKKILSALFLNAIEAMGGSQKQNIIVKSWEKEGCFVFTLEDRGQGLTEESAAKAFNLYYSTKSQLGVGLNLAESLVIANKGSLELLPGEGAGAKALIRLPMSCFLKTQVFKSIPFREKGLKNFEIKTETDFLSTKHKSSI